MKSADQDVFQKRLYVHVTDRAKVQSAVGTESMNQTLALHFLIELLLDGNKHRWPDNLKLDRGLIINRVVDQ